jgi:ACS family hexuronate transporter-like MFS transporter
MHDSVSDSRRKAFIPILSLRWRIALLISLAIAISYLDRQTLSVTIAAIQLQIPITNTQFSNCRLRFCCLCGYVCRRRPD